jgi:hypothetical protein
MNRSLAYVHSSRGSAGVGELTIRRARPADAAAIADLAALDSARPLTGERLVAALDGRLAAAVSLHDGRTIADPFVPSAEAVDALRLYTAGARSAAARPRRGMPRIVPRRVSPKFA